ncbi:MAG: hypothetical protein M5U34_22930 [Chloroflexi bacterium]|nr:hypothetical protein [Chloroflexota bacterium]
MMMKKGDGGFFGRYQPDHAGGGGYCWFCHCFCAANCGTLYGDKIAAEPLLLPMTVSLMRVMLLSTVIFAASGVVMGALNARQHFFAAGLSAVDL